MLTFVILQETDDQIYQLFSQIMQISITNPNNNIVCAVTKDTFDKFLRYNIKNVNLIHFEIDINKTIKKYTLNWINSMNYAIENYGNAVYISYSILLANKIPLHKSLLEQNVAFIKLNYKASDKDDEEIKNDENDEQDNDNKNDEDSKNDDDSDNIVLELKHDKEKHYLTGLFYISNTRAVDCIKKYFNENIGFLDEIEDEYQEDTEKRNKYLELWKNVTSLFADTDDGIICVTDYISDEGILKSSDFFRKIGSLKLSDVSEKDGIIRHKDDIIWGFIIDSSNFMPSVRNINTQLTAKLISSNSDYLPLINLLYSKNGVRTTLPMKKGIAHWNRENSGFYNYLKDVCDSSFLLSYTGGEKGENFYLGNYALIDNPGVKFITNSLIYSFRILYFDYDNESLELFDELDKPTDFIGYYSAYPKILEAFNQSQDVKRIGTKTIKENEYSNEEEFTEYLDDLITFKYFTVDKYTPKSRIADCLKLGVVPRLSDDTKLLEIEEIAKDKETEWEILSEKCKEYYTNNLSINIIADKLVRTVFNM